MTFNDAAPASAGTPNNPATGTSNVPPDGTLALGRGKATGVPGRVSATRTGAREVNAGEAVNHPFRSTTMSVIDDENTHTFPSVPGCANAIFAIT